jgi:PPOX class probable F420-dependent enzyme
VDRHTTSRLKKEKVVWLVTASEGAHPQAVPVWYVWDGKAFLIHAQDGIKVRHVRENPYVELHLNSDEVGDDVVRVSGRATLSKTASASEDTLYFRKYGRDIRDLGMTNDDFSRQYSNVIRVARPRFH